jgi:hypothetical protein
MKDNMALQMSCKKYSLSLLAKLGHGLISLISSISYVGNAAFSLLAKLVHGPMI